MTHPDKAKLSILQICSSRSWGGMEMHVVDLARLLTERGHFNLILTSPSSSLARKTEELDLPVKTLEFGGYFQPVSVYKIKSFLKANKFDILMCHYGKDLWSVVPAKDRDLPLIFVKHIGTQKAKRDFAHRYLYQNVDKIIANSSVIYQNILNTHPVTENQVQLLHLGIDQKKFSPNKEFRRSARTEFGFSEDEFIVGISGRLQRWKGYYEFLETASELTPKYPKLKFLAIGGPTAGEEKEAEAIQKKAWDLNLDKALIFTGFRNDVPRLLNALDLFVFPSYAEAYGLALLEAMATGLPVIASRCDGVLDIVEHNVTGLLVEPRSTHALSMAVEKLYLDANLRQSVASAGYQLFLQKFTSEIMLDKLEELFYQFYGFLRI